MDDIWARLEHFLQRNAPKIYDGLAQGATEDEIAAVEDSCGFSLPPDVRHSYLRHDGQMGDFGEPQGGTFIPCCFGMLSMAKILFKWQGNIEVLEDIQDDMPDGGAAGRGVKAVFLDPAWVPFAKDTGGNQICLDFDPGPGGGVGQIVLFDHEADGQQCLAPSFRDWLNGIVSDLESGRSVWHEELSGFCSPE